MRICKKQNCSTGYVIEPHVGKPLNADLYSLVGCFVQYQGGGWAVQLIGDRLVAMLSSPSLGTGAWVAARPNPLRVCCIAHICPSHLTASQLWRRSESSARRNKYSICWEAVSLPWSPAEWALSVCLHLRKLSSEPCYSVFKFANLARLSVTLASVPLRFCSTIRILSSFWK